MKSILILAALLSLSLFCSASTTLADTCGVVEVNDVAMFNLCPLLNTIQNVTQPLVLGIPEETYNISFVNPVVPSCIPGNANNLVYATATNDLGDCFDLADATDPSISALDSSDEGAGIVLTYSNYGNSSDYEGLILVVQLSCNSSADTPILTSASTVNSTVLVVGSSSDACPYLSLNQLANFMEEYKVVFVVIFVILGIFICFFGYQTLKVTIFIIATILVTIALGLLAFNFTHLDTPKWALWVIFAVCVVIGLICGVVAVKFEAVGFIALGLVLGAVGGLFLFNLVLAPFVEGKKYVLYVVCVILAIIGGLIAYKVWKKVVIVATAIIGSYLIVRALSVVIGGFPSEESIASGTAHFSGVTYAYLVAIVVLAIGGGFVQYKRQQNSDNDDEQNAYERMMGGNNYGQNYGQNYGGGY